MMKNKKTKVLFVLGIVLGALTVFATMKIDEGVFSNRLEKQFVEMETNHEIASYEISSESKGFDTKEYKVVVKHNDERAGKYPTELVLVRKAFSPTNLKFEFE